MMEKYCTYQDIHRSNYSNIKFNPDYNNGLNVRIRIGTTDLSDFNIKPKDSPQQKNIQHNFYKKKKLRRDSSDNLNLTHRMKSFSLYNMFSESHVQKDKKCYELKQNRNNHRNSQNTDDKQSNPNVQNFSRSQIKFKKQNNIKFTKTLGSNRQILLNWGKSLRKKMRRNTGLIQYNKTQKLQSTFDSKKQVNSTFTHQSSMSEYFSCSLGEWNNKNSRKIDLSLNNSNYMILMQNKIQLDQKQQSKSKELKRSDFQIGKKLGAGNFGQAYLVRHKQTKFICAMKIMKKQKIKSQKYENQIARQVSIQSYLRHPNVVELYGVFQDYFNVYLLMQYCPDGHLFGMIRKNMRLQEEEAASIVKGTSEGIDYLHRQMVIHRDLKPQNIFMSFDVPKIGDFGWAVYMGKNGQLRRTSSGSPLYYSPQIVQKTDYDEKIDIWGIGTIAYECLIGMVPFKIYSLMNLNRIVDDQLNFPNYVQISRQAKDFIQKCLMKRPEERLSIQTVLKHQFIKYCTQ